MPFKKYDKIKLKKKQNKFLLMQDCKKPYNSMEKKYLLKYFFGVNLTALMLLI